MIRILLIGFSCIFILIACNSNNKKFNDFADDLEKVSSNFKQLEGKWTGTFQKLNPTFDTLYYEDLTEKLEYQLSGGISDSSLVKSIVIKDTFDILPIAMHFFNIDSLKLTAEAKISSKIIELQISVTADISQNLRGLKILHFGELQLPTQSKDSFLTNINIYQYESLQQALTSENFELELIKQSKDSLVFGLPYGYGLLKLGK
ncbi:hypothetical protein [Marivirga sp.]|uniref:hypothetical protein n=1 Tax=Marivirga sp. TaxID=2018662 RepID=UPI0025FD9705|nr:hypothetical protein [Marivirga sp.]